MRTVRMLGHGRVEVIDVAEPEPRDGLVVVEMKASALCGTERHVYLGDTAADNQGHEGVGVVTAVSPSSRMRVGQRVSIFSGRHCGTCRYCQRGRWILCEGESDRPERFPAGDHAERALVREDICLPFPDDVPFDVASILVDAVGTPYHALRRLGLGAADCVLVVGQGPIGLGATLISHFTGARVIAVEKNEMRAKLSTECGADVTLDPDHEDVRKAVDELTGGAGVDVAIECSASELGGQLCLDATAPGGRVAFVGIGRTLSIDLAPQLILKDLQIIGSWYSDPSDFDELVGLVRRGLAPERMISHRFALEDAPEAFEAFFSGAAAKVVLHPQLS